MMRRRPLHPRAFSLIEILIAVTVLALGLLGLGMVFPVVVRQQRTAQDSIQGLSAARSASEYLRGRQGVVDGLLAVGTNWYPSDGHSTTGSSAAYDGFWLINQTSVGSTTFVTDRTTGLVSVGTTSAPQYLNVGERLAPAPFTGAAPQFVWDFALRASAPGQVQAAVFTRRIDAGIRIPTGAGTTVYSLSNVLTGEAGKATLANEFRRVPVAVDKLGRPTLNGLDEKGARNYSLLRTIKPTAPGPKDGATILRLDAGDAILLAQARQPGQKLVDNSGIIHTVARASEEATNAVVLERALTEFDRAAILKGQVQYVLSPQVPAAVHVVTLQK